MKNHIINLSIGIFELLLFVWALIIPSVEMSTTFLIGLAGLYSLSVRACSAEAEDYKEVFKKYYGLPLFLIVLYLMNPEPTLKLGILVFSAQASLKMIQNFFLSSCGRTSPY